MSIDTAKGGMANYLYPCLWLWELLLFRLGPKLVDGMVISMRGNPSSFWLAEAGIAVSNSNSDVVDPKGRCDLLPYPATSLGGIGNQD